MMHNHFADIILPLAVKGTFTYRIPEEMNGKVFPGSRVLVQFGKKNSIQGSYSESIMIPRLQSISDQS